MDKWRCIISPNTDGPGNMAVDEALFDLFDENNPVPILRFYGWDAPAITIGYFQKHAQCAEPGIPLTRRLTGGLTVRHGKDISYAVVASAAAWPFIYKQEETYQYFHSLLSGALAGCGVKTTFADVRTPGIGTPTTISCVQTLYPHDVLHKGEKIIGSCQRRRGRKLLMQGSLHCAIQGGQQGLADAFRAHAAGVGVELALSVPIPEEMSRARELEQGRYRVPAWNEHR